MSRIPRRRPVISRRQLPYFRKSKVAAAPPPAAGKTAWDKVTVVIQAVSALAIIVPLIALYVSVRQFNTQQTANAADRLNQERQATLTGYLDDMSALVLDDNLPKSKPGDPVRAIAVARTLTAVRGLDGERKGTLIRYLWEGGLLARPQPVVKISNADLSGAIFNKADLAAAALSQLSLNSAQFVNATLIDADLDGSGLFDADLLNANLSSDNLSHSLPIGAYMKDADLAGANLTDADLTGADLAGANLAGANLTGARYNSKPEYVEDPQGVLVLENPTQWPRGFDARATGAICYTC